MVAVVDGPPEHKMSNDLKKINTDLIIRYLESKIRWEQPEKENEGNDTPFVETANPAGKPERILCELYWNICLISEFVHVFQRL